LLFVVEHNVTIAVTVAVAWFEVTPLPDAVATFVTEPFVRSVCVML
jgi:hypothetical protein